LEEVGIITSRTTIPYDPRPAYDPSGIRLGTPAVTTRGMKEKEMAVVARLIREVLTGGDSKSIKKEVQNLCRRFSM